ncbi:glycosyltransferase family 2 protein [Parapedobacter pyrenivorans]|uniref:glycosyltransferase family 2 protein n=1 Tax=Parapedobacter pyrenivorans TaxID=1305674 RepID=UPI00333FF319
MERVSVSFIIVNFRTADLVLRCIQSIRKHTKELSYEVVVVDNASGDDSAEKLGDLPGITFIANPNNVGFGGANNQGAKFARGRYFFFLNPDTLLLTDAARYFTDFMNDSANIGVGCCGGDLLDEAMERQVSYGNFPSLRGVIFELGLHRFFRRNFEKQLSIGVKNEGGEMKVVDYISGADMFVRREVFKQLGGFDEDFFLYFEETEFAYRMKEAGYYSVLLPEVQIIHLEGGSHQITGRINLGKSKYFESSRLKFFKKTKGSATAMLVKTLLASQAIGRACLHWDSHYLKLFRIIVRS